MVDQRLFKQLVILNLLTSSHCTATHIALNMSLSYIVSNSILVFTFFTGLYLMSMGLGTLFVERISTQRHNFLKWIILNSLIGILLANPGIFGIILSNEFGRHILASKSVDYSWVVYILSMVLTVIIGMVSGAELPLFSRLSEEEKWPSPRPVIGILTSDYFGAFVGIMGFTFIFNPFFGLFKAVLISQLITLTCINILFFQHYKLFGKTLGMDKIIYLVDGYLVLSFLFMYFR